MKAATRNDDGGPSICHKWTVNDMVMILLSSQVSRVPAHQVEADGFAACIPKAVRLEEYWRDIEERAHQETFA
jgi:hypothetical protein